ncbi:YheC/YheD family protein [Paenibacillus lentus]|uniref:YheC/YheD family protein n=1 Tax=Paenibacillus lentus TaxID=1338368 RepID=UPI0036611D38
MSYRKLNKWSNYVIMRREKLLRQYLPPTRIATKRMLYRMLSHYGMVYMKPVSGQQGRGVMRVEKHKGGRWKYVYQHGKRKRAFANYHQAYASLCREMKGERYIVQKGIWMLTHRGRPFDLRQMIQRAPRGGFATTGTLARVAHPRKIVTNGSQGGSIYSTDAVLRKFASPANRRKLYRRMNTLAHRTVRQLWRVTPGIKELGMDYAIDHKLKLWILEVNSKPGVSPYTLLRDKSIIRRIVRYGRAYGKKYSLVVKRAKRGT